MASWRGNKTNPSPNPVQEDLSRSEKRADENRSLSVRRDTDKEKNQKITLMDIDKIIFDHLERMQFSVIDEGNTIKVPIFYGAPEKWVAARRDGFIRDQQGKIQLPAIIFRRTNSENDDDVEIFNKYVRYPIIQKYTSKNKYTQFAILSGQNSPVNEVYNVTMADHLILTYSFIVWTEYHEQMNPIIEKLKFNAKDYWGTEKGFKFRCKVEGFTHTIELSADDDRIIKTEFNLITNGYILPETYQILDKQYPTTEKLFTPKKIVIGTEIVASDFDMSRLNKNSEKWKSQLYPNLDRGDEPIAPKIVWGSISDTTVSPSLRSVLSTIKVSTTASGWTVTTPTPAGIQWQPVPSHPNSPGSEGWMAHDDSYLYIYSGGMWLRTPMNTFI